MTAAQAMERAVQNGRITQKRLERSLAPPKGTIPDPTNVDLGYRLSEMLLDSWHKTLCPYCLPRRSRRNMQSVALDSPVPACRGIQHTV